MNKLKYILIIIMFVSSFSYGQIYRMHKIDNALDGSHNPIGKTLQTLGNTGKYKSYEQAVTTNTEFDLLTDLGRYGSAGYFINDDGSTSATIAFSTDGTNYGDTITVKAGETFTFNTFIIFQKLRISSANISGIRCVVR